MWRSTKTVARRINDITTVLVGEVVICLDSGLGICLALQVSTWPGDYVEEALVARRSLESERVGRQNLSEQKGPLPMELVNRLEHASDRAFSTSHACDHARSLAREQLSTDRCRICTSGGRIRSGGCAHSASFASGRTQPANASYWPAPGLTPPWK